MKIYTRTGDAGDTSLFDGRRVRKHDVRTEAYGTVDELNSFLGFARSLCRDEEIAGRLMTIQRWLFVLAAELANPGGSGESPPRIGMEQVTLLESMIDVSDEELAPLSSFILPGGDTAAGALHQARTVCRRAERRITALAETGEEIPTETALKFVNRLSDTLFALARLANHRAGAGDTFWVDPRKAE